MLKAILFDLDGTLLPITPEVFAKAYFTALYSELAPYGFEKDSFIKAMWAGIDAMKKNDGKRKNEEAFWDSFEKVVGRNMKELDGVLKAFYKNKFDGLQSVCQKKDEVGALIKRLKIKYRLVLATNPVFPMAAQVSRLKWTGSDPADFEYITSFENSSFCKPKAEYYESILQKLNLRGEECIMVGNDVGEDMPAAEVGMKVFLLPEFIINTENADISKYPSGDYGDLEKYIETL